MKRDGWIWSNSRISKIFRSLALHINALFPFLLSFRVYINGQIIKGLFFYVRDYLIYMGEERKVQSGFPVKLRNNYPCLTDRFLDAGITSQHYFYQDIWAARKVRESGVAKHYDIGSSLDGFIAHCLSFCKVVMLDIRPCNIKVKNFSFQQADCTCMDNILTGSIESLSTLHAVEHFGLGRYGDRIDPLGHEKVIKEIIRIIKPNGNVLFSLPIGIERVEFNGHRIFDAEKIIGYFEKEFKLIEFSVIDDEDNYYENVNISDFKTMNYGCGLFHFRKMK